VEDFFFCPILSKKITLHLHPTIDNRE